MMNVAVDWNTNLYVVTNRGHVVLFCLLCFVLSYLILFYLIHFILFRQFYYFNFDSYPFYYICLYCQGMPVKSNCKN